MTPRGLPSRSWPLACLLVLVALAAPAVPGQVQTLAETRVWAASLSSAPASGVSTSLAAASHLGRGLAYDGSASGATLAAEGVGGGARILLHYTDEVGRQGIERSGEILPGSTGRVYLTTDSYATGAEAQQGLAMSRTPTGYFEVPTARLSGLTGPSPVAGGTGVEYWVEHVVGAIGLKWTPLG